MWCGSEPYNTSSRTVKLTPTCFPGVSAGKGSACNAGDLGSIPGLGRSPGEGKGYPLQYSGLENSMDRRAWQAIVHRVTESQTLLMQLTMHAHSLIVIAVLLIAF